MRMARNEDTADLNLDLDKLGTSPLLTRAALIALDESSFRFARFVSRARTPARSLAEESISDC